MHDYVSQADALMRAYLKRTLAASEAIERGDDDAAVEALRLVSAAFHNLRALDACAHASGVDIAGNAALRDLGNTLVGELNRLTSKVHMLRTKLARQCAALSETRRQIGLYRSWREEETRFTRQV